MSGICAIWKKRRSDGLQETLRAMCSGLTLNPSERVTQIFDGEVGLGVSARFATQQSFENDRVLLVCEAELYGGERAPGDHAPDNATAAFLAGLYERLDAAFVEKLRGDFAVLLWDKREKILMAATDQFGVHPLAYYEDEKTLLVSSRTESLLRSGCIPVAVNPRALANCLNFSVNLAPESILKNVNRLSPGTILLASPRTTERRKYWDLRYDEISKEKEDALGRRLESVLEESVKAHCKNDAFSGIGAFLSGGTDSSTVVGLMERLGRGRVQTFSIGFDEQHFDELSYARITAKRFAADYHEFLVRPQDCFECLPDMIRYFDEPFGNSSAVPTYFCARLAAQNGVTALLAGDGGDELFGGNERYATDSLFGRYHKVPWVVRKGVIEPGLAVWPLRNGIAGRARSYIRRANQPNPQRFYSYHFLSEHSPEDVFEHEFLESLQGYSVLDIPMLHYGNAVAGDDLNRLMYLDVKMLLADSDLLKVTRMSEMAGVQARFPFLDVAVAEFSGTIPANLKVKGLEKRYLFKQAFRNLLPEEVLHKKKHGFGIPVSTWLKTDRRLRELSRDTLLSERTWQRGQFRRSFIEELFQKHEQDASSYYGDTLWTLLMIELWQRLNVDVAATVSA